MNETADRMYVDYSGNKPGSIREERSWFRRFLGWIVYRARLTFFRLVDTTPGN